MDFSREFGLRPDIVEKDYVLGWLLAAISNHNELASMWVFKGGTCLKKCFFAERGTSYNPPVKRKN
jgi:predicted nucleotidyltransferase component of viral defense system